MKELIREQIGQVSKLDDRIILKELLNGVFMSLYEENISMYEELERKVYDELDYETKYYVIKTGLIHISEYDETHHLMRPISIEDTKEVIYNMNEIQQCINENRPYFVNKIFLESDYLSFKKMLKEFKEFKGDIITDKGNYVAKFSMEIDNTYIEKAAYMYQVFALNGVPWNTINMPYAHRMGCIYLTGIEGEIPKDVKIKEIVFDFGTYGSNVKSGMIPIWNIHGRILKSEGFAMPCEDHVNYLHNISTESIGGENGCLISDKEGVIKFIKKGKTEMTITSSIGEACEWSAYVIVQEELKKIDHFTYPIMTNKKADSFTQKLSSNCQKPIKTKIELIRLLESYEVSQHIEFSKFELKGRNEKALGETYSMNSFIQDEIREWDYGKRLVLLFKAKNPNFFLIRDVMSFLVSEVQLLYPEYQCEGKLV